MIVWKHIFLKIYKKKWKYQKISSTSALYGRSFGRSHKFFLVSVSVDQKTETVHAFLNVTPTISLLK